MVLKICCLEYKPNSNKPSIIPSSSSLNPKLERISTMDSSLVPLSNRLSHQHRQISSEEPTFIKCISHQSQSDFKVAATLNNWPWNLVKVYKLLNHQEVPKICSSSKAMETAHLKHSSLANNNLSKTIYSSKSFPRIAQPNKLPCPSILKPLSKLLARIVLYLPSTNLQRTLKVKNLQF